MTMTVPQLDEFLTPKELAQITKITAQTWAHHRISGDTPPFVQVNKGIIRYRWGDVLEWLNQRKCISTSDDNYKQRQRTT